MSDLAIKVENLSKAYQLGDFSTGTLSRDIHRWWTLMRGHEDPFLKVGEINDRSTTGTSDIVWSLKNMNFEINEGDAVGIIGRNGAGKSTLLKVLSRVTSPTSGNIRVKGRIASLLEVGTGFHPDLTGRENIFLNGAILGMRKSEIKKQFDSIVDFAGVERYVDTPVKRYSSGMYVRLAFAVAAHLESEILIVDEVLAVGDAEFQKKCLGKMNDVSVNEGRTILFVSHNLKAIQSMCKKAIHIQNGQILNMGHSKAIVAEYLRERNNLSNIKEYDKYLKYVKIEQRGEVLILEAEYKTDFEIDIPHLGFVIYNNEGTPVFASNPSLENLNVAQKRNYSEGKIVVEISEPKLINGEYLASIWFGDSKENFIQDLECLTFYVNGMTLKNQYNQTATGNVVPQTKWIIE
jgi:lipopolysaccharide transport system ATP-binding protein